MIDRNHLFGSFAQHAEQSQVWSNFTSTGNPGFSPSIARIAENLSLLNEWDSQGEDNVPFLATRNLIAKFVLCYGWTLQLWWILQFLCGLNSPWFFLNLARAVIWRAWWNASRLLASSVSFFLGFPWEKHRRNMEKHAKTWKHNGCIVDNYDVLMCNVIYLILYEWETTMYSNPQ
jgi:hypothetical protein